MKKWLKNLLFPIHRVRMEHIMTLRKKCQGGGRIRVFLKMIYRYRCSRYGCDIPTNTEIGENLTFPHGGYGIFISQGAKIGDNCVIFQQVTIGSNTLKDSKGYGSPTIGNNVYIGAGAKIIGNVTIGDYVRIGANAVVVKDVPTNATVVVPMSTIIPHTTPRDNTFVRYEVKE